MLRRAGRARIPEFHVGCASEDVYPQLRTLVLICGIKLPTSVLGVSGFELRALQKASMTERPAGILEICYCILLAPSVYACLFHRPRIACVRERESRNEVFPGGKRAL